MRLNCIIKLGGSLLYDFEKTKSLLDNLVLESKGNFAITVGSGKLGELYKEFIGSNQIPFNDSVRDYSNLQSINASVLASLNSNYIVCENKESVFNALVEGRVPILDSRGFMDVFKDDIYQKGDVRAANLCKYFNCNNLIIVTNVNGIYDKDPNISEDSHIIRRITSSELKKMGRTSVDEGLAERIEDYNLTCYILGVDNLVRNNGNINKEMLESGTVIEIGEKVYEKKN